MSYYVYSETAFQKPPRGEASARSSEGRRDIACAAALALTRSPSDWLRAMDKPWMQPLSRGSDRGDDGPVTPAPAPSSFAVCASSPTALTVRAVAVRSKSAATSSVAPAFVRPANSCTAASRRMRPCRRAFRALSMGGPLGCRHRGRPARSQVLLTRTRICRLRDTQPPRFRSSKPASSGSRAPRFRLRYIACGSAATQFRRVVVSRYRLRPSLLRSAARARRERVRPEHWLRAVRHARLRHALRPDGPAHKD